MRIRESKEDYLEIILVLTREKGDVRSIDIVNELGFSRPTVSIAMKKLREEGLVFMDEDSYIYLTPAGQEIAEFTYEKHNIIAKALMDLGVSQKTAYTDACHIEHCISQETFEKLKERWSD